MGAMVLHCARLPFGRGFGIIASKRYKMTNVLIGTWEEIKAHDAELAGQRVRVTVLPAKTRTPNYAALESMREAEELERTIVPRSGGDSVLLVREARDRGMYGHEKSE